ncbi:MAG: DUF2934 domain-containing protein [Opitutaceae bacterium]
MTTSFSSATKSTVAPSHDEIAHDACELWAAAGQPEGRDDEFWLEAEHGLLAARQEPDVTAVILATLARPVTRANKAGNGETRAKVRRGQ